MSSFETLLYTKTNKLATITFNRPDNANGINYQLAKELADLSEQIIADSDIKAVILTANGRFFSAGGDVKAMAQYDDPAIEVKRLADALHIATSNFARMTPPLIIAVNGPAAGAGFSTAISGDYVIASESANFTMAYSKVGLSPDGSASYYLPRLIGVRKTQELMFTNRTLTAAEALDWGMINQVVADDELASAAESIAKIFLNGAARSNSAIKKLLLATYNNDIETQMALESQLISESAGCADGQEGLLAFSEKRKPVFE